MGTTREHRHFRQGLPGLPSPYGVGGFIFAALGCALYNMVAGWVGGIEIELSEG